MALMLAELYDALREANVSEPSARKAAQAVASYEAQLAAVRGDLTLLKWMAGTNVVLTIAVLARLLHG